jgi:Holliday junction resolvase
MAGQAKAIAALLKSLAGRGAGGVRGADSGSAGKKGRVGGKVIAVEGNISIAVEDSSRAAKSR